MLYTRVSRCVSAPAARLDTLCKCAINAFCDFLNY